MLKQAHGALCVRLSQTSQAKTAVGNISDAFGEHPAALRSTWFMSPLSHPINTVKSHKTGLSTVLFHNQLLMSCSWSRFVRTHPVTKLFCVWVFHYFTMNPAHSSAYPLYDLSQKYCSLVTHKPPSHVHILVGQLQTKYHFGSLCNRLASLTAIHWRKGKWRGPNCLQSTHLRLFQRPLLEWIIAILHIY